MPIDSLAQFGEDFIEKPYTRSTPKRPIAAIVHDDRPKFADDVAGSRSYLLRFARLQLRNDAWAEDVVAETMLAALETAELRRSLQPAHLAGRHPQIQDHRLPARQFAQKWHRRSIPMRTPSWRICCSLPDGHCSW